METEISKNKLFQKLIEIGINNPEDSRKFYQILFFFIIIIITFRKLTMNNLNEIEPMDKKIVRQIYLLIIIYTCKIK